MNRNPLDASAVTVDLSSGASTTSVAASTGPQTPPQQTTTTENAAAPAPAATLLSSTSSAAIVSNSNANKSSEPTSVSRAEIGSRQQEHTVQTQQVSAPSPSRETNTAEVKRTEKEKERETQQLLSANSNSSGINVALSSSSSTLSALPPGRFGSPFEVSSSSSSNGRSLAGRRPRLPPAYLAPLRIWCAVIFVVVVAGLLALFLLNPAHPSTTFGVRFISILPRTPYMFIAGQTILIFIVDIVMLWCGGNTLSMRGVFLYKLSLVYKMIRFSIAFLQLGLAIWEFSKVSDSLARDGFSHFERMSVLYGLLFNGSGCSLVLLLPIDIRYSFFTLAFKQQRLTAAKEGDMSISQEEKAKLLSTYDQCMQYTRTLVFAAGIPVAVVFFGCLPALLVYVVPAFFVFCWMPLLLVCPVFFEGCGIIAGPGPDERKYFYKYFGTYTLFFKLCVVILTVLLLQTLFNGAVLLYAGESYLDCLLIDFHSRSSSLYVQSIVDSAYRVVDMVNLV